MKRFKMYRVLTFFFLLLHLGCKDTSSPFIEETPKLIEEVIPNLFYGIDLNKYDVDTQKIRRGDTFGKILEVVQEAVQGGGLHSKIRDN